MSTLFTFSRSLHDQVWLYEALGFASANDTIVLTEEAVKDLCAPLTLASFLAKCTKQSIHVCVLREDLLLHGVEMNAPNVAVIARRQFVELTAKHSKLVAW